MYKTILHMFQVEYSKRVTYSIKISFMAMWVCTMLVWIIFTTSWMRVGMTRMPLWCAGNMDLMGDMRTREALSMYAQYYTL